MSRILYTDIHELKEILGIDPRDQSEDVSLNFINTVASKWIEEILNRPGLTYAARTRYYNGTGTQKLLLRDRPVFTTPVPVVLVDGGGYYGTSTNAFTGTALTYGTDFCVQLDTDSDGDGVDDASRCGILIRINDFWQKPQVREQGFLSPFIGDSFGNVKVTYTAGYTVDTMPAQLRMACNLLIARLRYILPLGVELSSESYEERAITVVTSEKQKLMTLVWPMISSLRNYVW